MLDSFPTLRRWLHGELDHIGRLALIELEGVALILLDLQDFHGQHRVLSLRHLAQWEVWELEANVEFLGEVIVDRCHLPILLKLGFASALVDESLDDVLILRAATMLSYNMELTHLLQVLSGAALLTLAFQSVDKVVHISLACERQGSVRNGTLGPESAVRNIDVDGETCLRRWTAVHDSHRGEHAFERLNCVAEAEALLATSEERPLDLGVLK